MIPLPVVKQSGLFQQNCAQSCEMYDACEGSASAPCGCSREPPERRYECESCYILCRERRSPGFRIEQQLLEGIDLCELQINQNSSYQFPIFIPLNTHESISALPLAWAGVDARSLLNEAKKKPVRPKPYLRGDRSIEDHLSLANGANLIAVLNGQDWLLEGFWGMRREDLWESLKRYRFAAVTGPTFSITREGKGFPASHNVFMQRRHHRVMQEVQEYGLFAVPNIYWRDEDDIRRWQDWLGTQGNVQVVTRDFSRTKRNPSFQRELAEFIKLLVELKRPLHVLLVGVGPVNGLTALRELSYIGCTVSVMSSYPIREAVTKGRELNLSTSGALSAEQNLSVSREQLILKNIQAVEDYLVDKASGLPIYQSLKRSLINSECNIVKSPELLGQVSGLG